MGGSQLEKNDLVKKIEILEQYNSQLTDNINKLNDEIRDRDSKADYLRMNVQVDKEMAKNYENSTLENQKTIMNLKGERNQLQEAVNNQNKNIEYYKHQVNKFEQKVTELQNIISKERAEANNFTQNVNKYKDEVGRLREENKKLVKMYNDSKDLANRMSNVIPNSSNTISSTEESNILRGLNMDLNKKLKEMETELNINFTEAKSLKDENKRLRNILEGYNPNLSSDRMSRNFSDGMSDA